MTATGEGSAERTRAGIEGVALLNGRLDNGQVVAEVSYEEIARIISEGRIVILKGVFDADRVLDFRASVARWAQRTPPYPHGVSPTTTPEVNYHRIDDGVIKSTLPHVFRQFGFNTLDALEENVGSRAFEIAEPMRRLQNAVAATNWDFSLAGLRVKILRYPAGGGFLAEHTHPIEPQRVGLITSLSRVGEDFRQGGTTFQTPFGLVDTNEHHDIGDIILFRYDLPHAVTAVDEGEEVDWNSETGKWSFVLDLRETHGLSQSKM